jgi:MOSC domain-containing protein YiiM
MAIEIVSVNVGRPAVLAKWPDSDVVSSIDKRPVEVEALRLTSTNLEGDEQADTRPTRHGGQVHGGVRQAVYAYPSEHFPLWAEELKREVGPGLFGENLTTRGVTEAQACIGDVWLWGDALLQISRPRGPCYKLGYRLGSQAARRRVRETGRVGWYFRVLREGVVPTSGTIEVVERHSAQVTVAEVTGALQRRGRAPDRILSLDLLGPDLLWQLSRQQRNLVGAIPEED